MGGKRGASRRGEFKWSDFPKRRDAAGWHCRKCGTVLAGRKTAWCGKECLKAVLLLVDWSYIRRCILRRDRYVCQICGGHATDVDHIVELADGGSFWKWENLRSLCHPCHKAKTRAMRKLRAERKKAVTMGERQYLAGGEKAMYPNWDKIKIGDSFTASDGETYFKTSDLCFNDAYGLEHYIDPLFDRKIGAPANAAPSVDTSAKIVKGTPTNEVNPEPGK
jgi:5-methylcytosine-specific restriction protein A